MEERCGYNDARDVVDDKVEHVPVDSRNPGHDIHTAGHWAVDAVDDLSEKKKEDGLAGLLLEHRFEGEHADNDPGRGEEMDVPAHANL